MNPAEHFLQDAHFEQAQHRVTAAFRSHPAWTSSSGYLDEDCAGDIMDEFNRRLTDRPTLTRRDLAHHVAELLRLTVSTRVLRQQELTGEFGIYVARIWLEASKFTLIWDISQRELALRMMVVLMTSPRGSQDHNRAMSALARHVETGLLTRENGRGATVLVNGDGAEILPIQYFLGSPMTDPTDAELEELEIVLREFRWYLEGLGVFVFAPALLRDPIHDRAGSNRLSYKMVDAEMMNRSDVAALFLNPSSLGVGRLVGLAEQHAVPILLVVGDGPVPLESRTPSGRPLPNLTSTMVRDPDNLAGTIVRGEQREATIRDFVDFVDSSVPRVAAHRDARVDRSVRDAEDLAEFQRILDEMSEFERIRIPDLGELVSPDRFRRLMNHPWEFGSRIGNEADAIRIIWPNPVGLDRLQREGLRIAAGDTWDEAYQTELASLAGRMLARSPALARKKWRKDSIRPEYWMNLDRASRA